MIAHDTIAAIATALGQGAIAVVRVSGPRALGIGARAFPSRDVRQVEPRRVCFGNFVDPAGQVVDQVLLTAFREPASYTGEDMIEISGHGGVLVTRKILQALLALGCRAAEPGEFTQRAFVNGKMDLTQAEAVMDLISAHTELALRAANEQLRGTLGEAIMALREDLLGITAHLEAYIDFPEEDIDPETGEVLLAKMLAAQTIVARLLASADQGRILREGARVVICGAPNVGKSSLLNLLLGFERAIVSPVPGTTRDTVEEVINLAGLPLRLIDTAGLRHSTDAIERQGMARTQAAMERADIVLEVLDGHAPPAAAFDSGVSTAAWVRVLNKADLGLHEAHSHAGAVVLSCLEHTGLEALTAAIHEALLGRGESWPANLVAINARHQDCLQRASQALGRAMEAQRSRLSPEFTAIDLREALDAVGEIVGKVDVEEILGQIFNSFCIGK